MNNKANHTIHFAEGSCVFQAGSSMFGDVHMEGSTIYQGMPKAPETQEAAPCEEEATTASKPSRRGPSKKFLFTSKDSNKEDEATRGREKERLCRYLSDHKLGNRHLTCDKKDTLNKVVTCFLREWRERGLIAEKPSGGAIFRFLTEVCGLTSEVTLASYSNKVVHWLDQPVDSFTKLDVKECFKEP